MNAKNHFKFSPYSAIKDGSSHEIHLEFKQCQADLRDVGFFLRKKTGFPKITSVPSPPFSCSLLPPQPE